MKRLEHFKIKIFHTIRKIEFCCGRTNHALVRNVQFMNTACVRNQLINCNQNSLQQNEIIIPINARDDLERPIKYSIVTFDFLVALITLNVIAKIMIHFISIAR